MKLLAAFAGSLTLLVPGGTLSAATAEYDTKEHWEIRAGASYLLTKHFSLIGQWHSQFGWGGGLRWQF